jgi:hypothetical protein
MYVLIHSEHKYHNLIELYRYAHKNNKNKLQKPPNPTEVILPDINFIYVFTKSYIHTRMPIESVLTCYKYEVTEKTILTHAQNMH